tara:strand:+ start:7428 stop:7859 length:432 start_codon:yes stop_codon:yes gene_type:complete
MKNPTTEVGLAQAILLHSPNNFRVIQLIREQEKTDNGFSGKHIIDSICKDVRLEDFRSDRKACARHIAVCLDDFVFAEFNTTLVDLICESAMVLRINPKQFFSNVKLFDEFRKKYGNRTLPYIDKEVMSIKDLEYSFSHLYKK